MTMRPETASRPEPTDEDTTRNPTPLWAVTEVDGRVKRVRADGYERGDSAYTFYVSDPENPETRTPVGEIIATRVWSVLRELPEEEREPEPASKRFLMDRLYPDAAAVMLVLIAMMVGYIIFR